MCIVGLDMREKIHVSLHIFSPGTFVQHAYFVHTYQNKSIPVQRFKLEEGSDTLLEWPLFTDVWSVWGRVGAHFTAASSELIPTSTLTTHNSQRCLDTSTSLWTLMASTRAAKSDCPLTDTDWCFTHPDQCVCVGGVCVCLCVCVVCVWCVCGVCVCLFVHVCVWVGVCVCVCVCV